MTVTVTVMLVVCLRPRPIVERSGLTWLEPVGRLAWPWYVPLGTLITVATGTGGKLSSRPDGQR